MSDKISAAEIAEAKKLRAKKYTWIQIGHMLKRSPTSFNRYVTLRQPNGKRIRGHKRHHHAAPVIEVQTSPAPTLIKTSDNSGKFCRVLVELSNRTIAVWASENQINAIRDILNNA